MNAHALRPASEPLRVFVSAGARRAALEALLRSLGHIVVPSIAEASIVLAEGSPPATGKPVVALGLDYGQGRLGRDASPEQVDAALRAVAVGLNVAAGDAGASFDDMDALETPVLLTPRELEVLSAVAGGATNKEIARDLGISLHTVKFHLESLMRKLDVATRTEAVSKAMRLRLLEPFRI